MVSFYLSDNSFIGRRHPATRLLMLLLAFAPPMIVSELAPMIVILSIYTLGAFASGAWRNLWRVKWFIVLFLLVSLSLWSIFHKAGDEAWFQWGPIAPSPGSAAFGLAMGLRLVSFLVPAIIFLSSTRIEDLHYGLLKLGIPYRGAFALSLAFRLTPLFTESAQQIATAQRVRGLDVKKGNIIRRTRFYIAILAPVMIAALRRANGLAIALEAKGFGLQTKRTSIMRYTSGAMDYFWLLFIGGLVALTIFYTHFHHYLEQLIFG
jgi:energy-coupling factor transport system permease protein